MPISKNITKVRRTGTAHCIIIPIAFIKAHKWPLGTELFLRSNVDGSVTLFRLPDDLKEKIIAY